MSIGLKKAKEYCKKCVYLGNSIDDMEYSKRGKFNTVSFVIGVFVCLSLSFSSFKSVGQTLSLGLLDNVEDLYRRSQILGLDSSNLSYMIRPIHLSSKNGHSLSEQDPNLTLQRYFKPLYESTSKKLGLYLLPVTLQQQFNSHHPYGMNDGSMIQAKGYQAQVSGGVFFKAGPLSIQLRPELVYAQNSDFVTVTEPQTGNPFSFRQKYAEIIYNRIDNPPMFDGGRYSKANWGQSSIRLNFDPISFGLSTENLWWGPGIKNSLLMTNNATGFKHLTLNTTRPIKTYIGSFEAQLIAGRLELSGVADPAGSIYYRKPDDWRYISSAIVTYQPKWVPGLFLGVNRAFVINSKDLGNSFFDYVPFLSSLEKISSYDKENLIDVEDRKKRDQYLSLFARWVMPESKAEIYFEYGRNDHAVNVRDFLSEPEHARAYVVGFRKLVPLRKQGNYIQATAEFTQLESTKTSDLRDGPIWYVHYQVVGGYTNRGQVLGAGIGPGSNMQSLDVAWVSGLKKIGISFDRVVNNNDFFYAAGLPLSEIRRHWVDLVVGGKFDWTYKNFTLSSGITYIHSLNYQWRFKENPGEFYWDWPKQDADNIQVKAGLMYNF